MTHITMRKPDIVIRNGGVINLSANVVSRLELREGDVISLLEDKSECYIYVQCRREDAIGSYSGVCRPSKQGSRHLRAHSSVLCSYLSSKLGGKNIDLIVGELVTIPSVGNALPIIMRNRYDSRD